MNKDKSNNLLYLTIDWNKIRERQNAHFCFLTGWLAATWVSFSWLLIGHKVGSRVRVQATNKYIATTKKNILPLIYLTLGDYESLSR